MVINCDKTEIIVFNKAGRLTNITITYCNILIECVQKYTYLGVTFNASGTLSYAKEDLSKKGKKALFQLKTALQEKPHITTILHLFNLTMRPILLYGSEICGYKSSKKIKNNPENFILKEIDTVSVEKVYTKLCKFALGV